MSSFSEERKDNSKKSSIMSHVLPAVMYSGYNYFNGVGSVSDNARAGAVLAATSWAACYGMDMVAQRVPVVRNLYSNYYLYNGSKSALNGVAYGFGTKRFAGIVEASKSPMNASVEAGVSTLAGRIVADYIR